MGKLIEIFTPLHKKTSRDYIGRMVDNKVECMKIAKRYGKDYWDGDRRYGYGGYKYDGRWEAVAKRLIEIYKLQSNAKILDIGCGKGYLLYELKKLLSEAEIAGFDISEYAIQNSKEEIRENLFIHKAQNPYPFGNREFDLVISINTLHNLHIYELKSALKEIERVGKNKYVVVEGYRNEQELFNLQCWVLTGECFFTPPEWIWLFKEFGYTGDYEFIYFE
ncbi:MAG: class I SAM-dependent methyltransferase [Nitrospirota bacterium]